MLNKIIAAFRIISAVFLILYANYTIFNLDNSYFGLVFVASGLYIVEWGAKYIIRGIELWKKN